jgi:DNA transposition AAA+ family ATPase
MKDRFVRTKSVNKYFGAIERISHKRKGIERMLLITGEPGLGKTEASLHWIAMNEGIMIRTLELMTGPWLLQTIAYELGGEPYLRSKKNIELICELLHEKPKTIIFDEVDRFTRKPEILETLRDIHDLNLSTIIFVGEEQCDKKLAQNRRLFRRFVEVVKFERLDLEGTRDFLLEISDLKYQDDAVEKIFLNTNGKISGIMGAIHHAEAVARGMQVKTISGKDLR